MKAIKYLLLIFCIIGVSGCSDKSFHFNEKIDNDFSDYVDEVTKSLYEGNPMDINFRFLKPEEFGLTNQEYEGIKYEETDVSALKKEKSYIKDFDYYSLSFKNRLVYETLIDYINSEIELSKYYYLSTNLGSYLGYQANIPLYLSLYRFDDLSDVEDYFVYLEKTKEDFEEIIRFETSKIKKKTSLPNSILDGVIDQCEAIYNDDNFYLKTIFKDKISSIDTDDDLVSRNNSLVDEFQNAYRYLAEAINENLYGKQSKTGALNEYGNGRDYYTALVRKATGTKNSIPKIKAEIEEQINIISSEFYTNLMKYYSKLGSQGEINLNDLDYERFSEITDYKEIVDFYYNNEKLWESFPKINGLLEYNIEMINEALEDNFSPNAYLNSPLDGFTKNTILVNEGYIKKMGSDNAINNYEFASLAHEGIPGHMYYDYAYKQSENYSYLVSTLSCLGTSEGWATYVELLAPEYSSASDEFIELKKQFNLLNGYLQAYLEIEIHYYGWKVNGVSSKLGISKADATSIYNQLIEIPGNTLEYYYGYLQLIQTKEKVQNLLKENYSDLAFHTFLLNMGPIPFSIINKHIDEVNNYLPKTA